MQWQRQRERSGRGARQRHPRPASRRPILPRRVDANASALELQVRAWRKLNESGNATVGNRSLSAARRAELRELLNQSFASFVGLDRVADARVFELSPEVAAGTGRTRPNVTAHLVVANGRLAEVAISDAERTRSRLDARGVDYDEDAVEEHLREARRAVAQAEHVQAQSPNPIAAITHYRRAWEHAQAGMDVMDRNTTPEVTITRRADPVRNGSANYTVVGTVFDVRPWTIENVTVIAGDERVVAPVRVTNATPAQTGRFAARIRVPAEPVNLTVVATDGEPVSNLTDDFEPNEGRGHLALDGDGLPDVYERNATGTDPLNRDSDSQLTAADEANNGTIDGREDFDGDFLAAIHERELGTDPVVNDTDEDAIHDGFEVLVTGTDPLDEDSDSTVTEVNESDDGTLDGEEDLDGDGLTNAREQRAGSDPRRVDGDADGLDDPAELRTGTDPLAPDSDEDRLLDGEEPDQPFETDPLDPDSDDDGILDGNETYSTSVTNDSLGASVEVTAPGGAAAEIGVGPEQRAGFDNDLLDSLRTSPVVDVTGPAVTSLRVTLAYDEAAVDNESDVTVFRFDDEDGVFRPLPTTVDERANKASAEPDRPGLFVLMEESAWREQVLPSPDDPPATVDREAFPASTIDCSGYCRSTDDGLVIGVSSAGRARFPGSDSTTSTTLAVGSHRLAGEDGVVTDSTDGGADEQEISLNRTSENGTVTYWTNETLEVESNASGTVVRQGNESWTVEDDSGTDTSSNVGGVGVSAATALVSGLQSDTSRTTVRTIDTADASEVRIDFEVTGTAASNGSSVQLVAEGGQGARTLLSVSCSTAEPCPQEESDSIAADLTSIAGNEVELVAVIEGSGGISITDLDIHLVIDADGDGLPDDEDLCAATTGHPSTGCPPTSVDALTARFDQEPERVRVLAEGLAVIEDDDSSVSLRVGGEQTTWLGRGGGTTVPIDVEETFTRPGRELTLAVDARGAAVIRVDRVIVQGDTDGDGLWNSQEAGCITTSLRFGCVNTSRTNNDTDGDGLLDGREMPLNDPGREIISSANDTDTDDDGLDDLQEVDGWAIDVVNESSCVNPCRYDSTHDHPETMNVTSDPAERDTDDDGLTDPEEFNRTFTDPRQEVTYNVTRLHEEVILDDYDRANLLEMGVSPTTLTEDRLTDATDEFDVVLADDHSIVFTALDNESRTDSWLSNEAELANETDPWDPDTDDDGLTDGQELEGVTRVVAHSPTLVLQEDRAVSVGLADAGPVDPDSDDDGWWDGWIGVYDAGDNSRNVVLFMEHLRDEDSGIQEYEIVQVQVGVHEASEAPVPDGRGYDIDTDTEGEHSNLHLGELHWGTNPTQESPELADQTELTVEVDYVAGRNPSRISNSNGVSLLAAAHRNYALYGFVETVEDSVDDDRPRLEIWGPNPH